MMSKAEVQKIVDDNIRDLRTALQLDAWFVRISYSSSLRVGASCETDPKRHEAIITFNPGEFDNEKDVLLALLHELLHIYHAEFDLYWEAVKEAVSCDMLAVMQPIFNNACEHVVEQLLRLLEHTFRTTPKRMIAAVKRKAKEG